MHLEFHTSRKSSGRPQELYSFDEQPLSSSFKKSSYDVAMLDLAYIREVYRVSTCCLRDDL